MNDQAINGYLKRKRAGLGGIVFVTVLYLITLAVFALLHLRAVRAFEMRARFHIINDDTIVLSQEKDFKEAKSLHLGQAELAVQTMFNRHPGGLDSEERLRYLFDRQSFNKFQEIVDSQTPEFEAKELHQKVEISEIKILKLKDRTVRVAVYGQLIRIGRFDGQPYHEALALKVSLQATHNPSLIHQRRSPTVVRDFKIHTEPILSR